MEQTEKNFQANSQARLSFPLSHDVTIGVCGEELVMKLELPVPMEIDQLISNAPAIGMFTLESFKENGEELMGSHKDDLWLHRPWTGASAPRAKHSAPVTHVEIRVVATGYFSTPKCGLAGGMPFKLVVHVVGHQASAK
jgi:hypothetical protein